MSGKSDTFEHDLLLLVLHGTTIAHLADNAAAAPITNIYVALHTADPSAGDQTTSEISYTGYARVGVARTAGGWTVIGNQAVNAVDVSFPLCTAGSATAAFASVGQNASGAGEVYYSGPLSAPFPIGVGTIPHFTPGNMVLNEAPC